MPQSRQDDFYALGLTIWEIFTGKVPFAGFREDEVERKILAGERVDTSEIEELDVRDIVEKYLEIGEQLQADYQLASRLLNKLVELLIDDAVDEIDSAV